MKTENIYESIHIDPSTVKTISLWISLYETTPHYKIIDYNYVKWSNHWNIKGMHTFSLRCTCNYPKPPYYIEFI